MFPKITVPIVLSSAGDATIEGEQWTLHTQLGLYDGEWKSQFYGAQPALNVV